MTSQKRKWQASMGQRAPNLPILQAKAQLLDELRKWKTLILIGETGSGKTTQLPQILLDTDVGKGGRIACTQPRRVAAMSVAHRVCKERASPLGQEIISMQVGYSVRFDDRTSAATRLKYCTDGMLLREALLDPLLKAYKVIILDEAHERSLQTDVLFSLVKSAQTKRKDLRVVVMSATLDAAKFLDFFPGAAAAYLQGRQFPVEVLYLEEPTEDYADAVLSAVFQIHKQEAPGDILCFLTGQEEIENLQHLILERATSEGDLQSSQHPLQVVSIFAAQTPEQQMKVFERAPKGVRKVILATNIAETSVTVPGVRYVVDTGFVKARFFQAREAVESLQVTPVSQAQARQRTGRAGREAPGKCFRLYTEETFLGLPATTAPEIQRVRLAEVVLTLKAIGIGDLHAFDFLDRPQPVALTRALEQLVALGALDAEGTLTNRVGLCLSRLPVDPCLGKILVSSSDMNCSRKALAIVSIAASDAPFSTSRKHDSEVVNARKLFLHASGDHLTLATVFNAYMKVEKDRNAWCKERFLNPRALKRARDIYKQLEGHMQNLKLLSASNSANVDPVEDMQILRALTAGLFLHAAVLQTDGSYKVLHSKQIVHIHPSSVLCGKKAKCIVFNELMQTTQKYALCVSAIEAAWLPELAPMVFS